MYTCIAPDAMCFAIKKASPPEIRFHLFLTDLKRCKLQILKIRREEGPLFMILFRIFT